MGIPKSSARVLLAVLALASVACTTQGAKRAEELGAPSPAPMASLLSVPSPPEWRPGDRWTYELISGNDRRTKTMEVVEVRRVRDVSYYVVRLDDIDHYYTLDLRWVAAVRNSKVQARTTPPHTGFVWPLEVGKRWTYEGVWEEPGAKRDYSDRFAVVAAEAVEVPAGRFEALRVVREGSTQSSDEYWFAPAVRSYVRWVGRRGEIQFEERLREYRPAPRLIPGGGAPAPGSK